MPTATRRLVLALLIIGPAAACVRAQEFDDYVMPEPYATGWALYVDNDALALLGRDQQYTGGFAFTLSGRRAREYWFSFDPLLKSLDRLSGFSRAYAREWRRQLHSIEFGMTAFTPEDIENDAPLRDDHPYGSLVFVAQNQESIHLERGVNYQSSFTLGVLGTRIPERVQIVLHDTFGLDDPQGWRNQISDGGEPTFRYTVARQQALVQKPARQSTGHELNSATSASIGYITEVGAGISWRWGVIDSPWWSFNPHFAEYINLGAPVAATEKVAQRSEFYFWSGLNVVYRLYNALLQGQFRDSEVTFERSELNELLLELSLGVTRELKTGLRLGFTVRARTPELDDADGPPPLWGGLIVSRSF